MSTTNRLVGILGGMGPEATADLFEEITRLTPARRDQDHVRVLIYSNPGIPDRTAAILEGGADPVPALAESARLLERAGAAFIAIPCNTAHYFLESIRAAVSVPVLDMIEEACEEFSRLAPHADTAGLLAATGTTRSGIYSSAFASRGVRVLTPADDEQESIHAAIREVKAGRAGTRIRELFRSAGAGLVARGARAVILGCTEIPLAFDESAAGYPVVNTTRVLAKAVLRTHGEVP